LKTENIYTPSEVEKLYNPVAMQVEKSHEFPEYRDSPSYLEADSIHQKNSSNILSQIHSRQCVRDILSRYSAENNVIYDIVIMTRFDNVIEKIISNIHEDCIYFSDTHGEREIFNDNLIVTNQENFLKLMNIEKILPKLLYQTPAIKFNIEELIVESAIYNRLLHKCRKTSEIRIRHM